MGEKEASLTHTTSSKTSAQRPSPAGPAGKTQDHLQSTTRTQGLSWSGYWPATMADDAEINNNINHNNGSVVIPVDQYAVSRVSQIHTNRSDATFNLISTNLNRQTVMSERKWMCWIFVGLLYFTLSWKYTIGGYLCSALLFPLLLVYTYYYSFDKCHPFQFVIYVFSNIKDNIRYILQMERKPLILLLAYTVTKVILYLFYPKLERSNGTPMSLILFTVYFIAIYIFPTLAVTVATYIIKFLRCRHEPRRILALVSDRFVRLISGWKKSIIFTVIIVAFSYLFDGDLTSILRYFGRGKSCWPLLIPQSLRDSLPYPLQHAWFKQWHHIFSNYQPSNFVREMIYLGREMEVIHVLPVLIGMYVLAQVFLPRENWTIKKVLFGCISGVVLSGVTSGALKLLLHRYRPNAYGNPYIWTGPSTATVNHLAFSKLDLSFPCGHTSVSTSVATCLCYGVMYCLQMSTECRPSLRFKIFLVVSIFSWPILVLISRVSECYHWTSDAIFGVS